MIEWLKELDPTVQAAIITGCATIIAGVFSLVKKGKGSKRGINIKQSQGIGNKGTQIGVQNNTNITIGNKTIDDGTIIIDGGTASGGGGIKYEPVPKKDAVEVSKNV